VNGVRVLDAWVEVVTDGCKVHGAGFTERKPRDYVRDEPVTR